MRSAVLLVLLAGCATMKPSAASPSPAPQPIHGASIAKWTTDGVEIEVLLMGTEHQGSGALGPAKLPGVVATSLEELPAEYRPQQPIDFTQWIAVTTPGLSSEVFVSRVTPQRITPEQTEFAYPVQHEQCGGASITYQRNLDAMRSTARGVLLIPRPARRLVIGLYDTRCPAPLP